MFCDMAKTKLVLFDIDGTLITSGGAGEHALRLALKERFGIVDDLRDIEIAGKTDSGITRRILKKHGLEQSMENISAFYDTYLHFLAQQLPVKKGRLLPGILELLEAIKALPDVAMALLTGNLSRGAELKLTQYGLWDYFEFGAFADDHQDRNQLGRFAQSRALDKHGVEFDVHRTFVIGDTPHDIDCGRAFGAKTAAIATGNFSREQLATHQPDFLFDDLSNVQEVIARLGL